MPPGVRRGAVTGYGVMPAPVRPIRSTRRQVPTARTQYSASTATYPPASTNPRSPRAAGCSAITGTTTEAPAPLTVIRACVRPCGARDQSARTTARTWSRTLPRGRSTVIHGSEASIR